jgi:hypothetical protein
MSKTPRTDEKVKVFRLTMGCVELPENHMVNADFARQLERELAEAQAEIESKDRLIKQMREALVVADVLVTNLIDVYVDKCASIYDFDRDIIKAALSAADGGE